MPDSLGSIWAAHSRPILTALDSLQGVQGDLVDPTGKVVLGSTKKLLVNQTEMVTELHSGHFFMLLPPGQHTLSVGEVDRLVTVVPGELTRVRWEVLQILNKRIMGGNIEQGNI